MPHAGQGGALQGDSAIQPPHASALPEVGGSSHAGLLAKAAVPLCKRTAVNAREDQLAPGQTTYVCLVKSDLFRLGRFRLARRSDVSQELVGSLGHSPDVVTALAGVVVHMSNPIGGFEGSCGGPVTHRAGLDGQWLILREPSGLREEQPQLAGGSERYSDVTRLAGPRQ